MCMVYGREGVGGGGGGRIKVVLLCSVVKYLLYTMFYPSTVFYPSTAVTFLWLLNIAIIFTDLPPCGLHHVWESNSGWPVVELLAQNRQPAYRDHVRSLWATQRCSTGYKGNCGCHLRTTSGTFVIVSCGLEFVLHFSTVLPPEQVVFILTLAFGR